MALIKCPDCGKKVSDRANQCIHCGCPLDELIENEESEELATMHIIRKSKFTGSAITSIVYIDGEEIISLNSGESCELTINPGVHQFSIRKGDRNSWMTSISDATMQFDVKPGSEVVLEFEPKTKMFLGFYFSMDIYNKD